MVNNGSQAFADQVTRAVVNGINLAALAQAAGIDPQSLLTGLLVDIPAQPPPGNHRRPLVDIPIWAGPRPRGSGIHGSCPMHLGLDEVTDATLTGLLALIGWNLSDPLNLAGLAVPGLNIVTVGTDLLRAQDARVWTSVGCRRSPNSVANEINNSRIISRSAPQVCSSWCRNKLADDSRATSSIPFVASSEVSSQA